MLRVALADKNGRKYFTQIFGYWIALIQLKIVTHGFKLIVTLCAQNVIPICLEYPIPKFNVFFIV